MPKTGNAAPGEGGAESWSNRRDQDTSGQSPTQLELDALGDMPAPPPRREIVEGVIAEGDLVILSGDPGSGKSTLAAQIAACVTNGSPLGDRACQQGVVIYAALERRHQLAARLWAAEAHEGRVLLLRSGRLNLVADADALCATVADLSPKLLIIDTYARATVGIDENGSKDTGAVVQTLQAVQDAMPGGAVLVIHHLAKGDGSGRSRTSRGSAALVDAADVEMQIRRDGAIRVATVTKANGISEDAQIAFEIVEVDGVAVAQICDPPVPAAKRKDAQLDQVNQERTSGRQRKMNDVARVLSGRPPFSIQAAVDIVDQATDVLKDIAARTDKSRKTRDFLSSLIKDGRAMKDADGNYLITGGRQGRTGTDGRTDDGQ